MHLGKDGREEDDDHNSEYKLQLQSLKNKLQEQIDEIQNDQKSGKVSFQEAIDQIKEKQEQTD